MNRIRKTPFGGSLCQSLMWAISQQDMKEMMMDYKFKIGDRVRVITIDDERYRGPALYQIGDVGRIISQGKSYQGNYALIEFDRLKETNCTNT